MKKWIIALAALSLMFASLACGEDDDGHETDLFSSTQTAAASASTAVPQATTSAPGTAAPQPTPAAGGTTTSMQYNAEPPLTIDANKRYVATIKMDIGDIQLELYPKEAPHHVNNFVFLAREGFYDGVTFHRVIPGFVAQAGDPTGSGSGGPGYTIQDEVNEHTFVDGALGMAKTSAPNSAGSQWFICYAPQPNLDGGYTVFGQLISGRDVLDKIAPRNPQSATAPGTRINTITIEES